MPLVEKPLLMTKHLPKDCHKQIPACHVGQARALAPALKGQVMPTDPRSVAGKNLEIAHEVQVLVVGAGRAGVAAARRAHDGGASVMLVDENPVPFDVMGESVPQIWGGRMGGQVRNRTAMMERMLESRPDLVELFEAGIDIRLGTACWGIFANQDNLGWMPGRVAGLLGDEGNQLVRFDQAIVATGRRDMGLAFPGWDLPGVMGAAAAQTLSGLYGALDSRRAVMIGSTPEALLAVLDLAAAGVTIAAVIEQAASADAPADLVARVSQAGIPIHFGEVPRHAISNTDGILGLALRETEIDCDTILLGVGAVPMVDLLHAAGAKVMFDNDRSGFVPLLNANAETSLTGIRAAGDCAGIWAAKSADDAVAESEGTAAADAALVALGLASTLLPTPFTPPAAPDIGAYRKAWVRAAVVEAIADMHVCQCEEVTAREILEVRPPRYLKMPPVGNEARSLAEILGDGPPDPDQIKRLTRAGMGPCQGRRCREQIQALLALQEDLALGAIPLAGYRSPVRPISLADAPLAEDPAIVAAWDSWFGMPRQWVPFWDVEPQYTVASLATEKEHVSE